MTLFGGFASTLGWPLTAWLAGTWDWRTACFAWTAIHLLIALPINAFGLPSVRGAPGTASAAAAGAAAGLRIDRTFVLLAVFGAATSFVTAALSFHLPGVLQAFGVGAAVAIGAAALFGPAQVAARLCEFALAHRFRIHPLASARFGARAAIGLTVGVSLCALLALLGLDKAKPAG